MLIPEGQTAYTMFRDTIVEVKILKVIQGQKYLRYKCAIASTTANEVEMERDEDRIFPSVQALLESLSKAVVEFK